MHTSSSASPSTVKFSPNCPYDEVVSSELALPVPIRVDLVDEHRPLLAAVPGQIALTIAVNVEPADPAGTGHGVLEDAGEDGLPLPGHVLRQADVDRQQRPNGLGYTLV